MKKASVEEVADEVEKRLDGSLEWVPKRLGPKSRKRGWYRTSDESRDTGQLTVFRTIQSVISEQHPERGMTWFMDRVESELRYRLVAPQVKAQAK